MTLLTSDDLDEYLINCLHVSSLTSQPYYHDILLFLYNTGFRISELKSLHTWTINQNNTVTCTTLKNSNNRILPIQMFQGLFYHSIVDSVNYIMKFSTASVSEYFKSISAGYITTSNRKAVTTHLFRHNFIKKLYHSNTSITEMKQITGIIKDEVLNQYIYSNLYINQYE